MFLNFFTLFLNNILVSVYIGCFCNEIDYKHLDSYISGAKLNDLFKIQWKIIMDTYVQGVQFL